MNGKQQRHQHILDLLSRNRIDSQDEFQELLLTEGVETTQSTLSRDLRELGIVKSATGYRLPEREPARPRDLSSLVRTIGGRLVSVDWGGNLVVLKTTGMDDARDVAAAIERARLHQATAALICEDAVLVVARTQAYAREIVRLLRENSRSALRRRKAN
jgi:transcriptional regulator of arginine metabolism